MSKSRESALRVIVCGIALAFCAGLLCSVPVQCQDKERTKTNSGKIHSQGGAKDRYLRQVQFEVLGAGCYACVKKIEMDLRALPGVEIARSSADIQPPTVTVVYDMDKTSAGAVVKKVDDLGYRVRNQRDSFYQIDSANKSTSKLLKMTE